MNPLALMLVGFGGLWLLGERERKSFSPRSNPGEERRNPTGYLIRTVSYTPLMSDAHKKHVGSLWENDLEQAYGAAETLAAKNHARVVIERGGTEPLAVFDHEEAIVTGPHSSDVAPVRGGQRR